MKNLEQCAQIMSDKEILGDALISQKQLTEAYNTYAGECVNEKLRSTMLGILGDEHKIQAALFSTMQNKGFYTTEQAPEQKIQTTRQKLSNQ